MTANVIGNYPVDMDINGFYGGYPSRSVHDEDIISSAATVTINDAGRVTSDSDRHSASGDPTSNPGMTMWSCVVSNASQIS